MLKHKFRKEILEKRLAHQSSGKKKIKDKKIQNHLETLEEFQKAKKILFYAPTHGEVDTFATIKKWIAKKNIYMPCVNKKNHKLHIHKIESVKNLEKGTFGILEPKKYCEKILPKMLDLAIIPGIAFDRRGHRIGFGMGFYDKLLKETKCKKIGLAYEFQIIKNVPGEPHDIPVDIIITEKRILNTQQNERTAKSRSGNI